MLKILCGLVAVVIVSLFVGGLAYSIWEGTGSIAFPVIAGAVLMMVYVDYWQFVRKGDNDQD